MEPPWGEGDRPDDDLWRELEAEERRFQGDQVAQSAIRLGFVGLFVFGFVLGPWALARVWRAESLGVTTNLGEVLGWSATYVGLLQLAFAVMWLGL